MNKINEIKQMLTIKENIHESVFQSYHILNYVLELYERGETYETVSEIVAFLRYNNKELIKI